MNLTLPDTLQRSKVKLEKALNRKRPAKWPEGEKRIHAYQVEGIANVLIPILHKELHLARIAYLFREKSNTRGETVLGKAKLAGPDLRYLGEVDYVIEINFEAWLVLVPQARLALVDHELAHCAKHENADGETSWIILPHDVEEFASIVKRWGLWQPNLIAFGKAVGDQLELFRDVAAAGLDDVSAKRKKKSTRKKAARRSS